MRIKIKSFCCVVFLILFCEVFAIAQIEDVNVFKIKIKNIDWKLDDSSGSLGTRCVKGETLHFFESKVLQTRCIKGQWQDQRLKWSAVRAGHDITLTLGEVTYKVLLFEVGKSKKLVLRIPGKNKNGETLDKTYKPAAN